MVTLTLRGDQWLEASGVKLTPRNRKTQKEAALPSTAQTPNALGTPEVGRGRRTQSTVGAMTSRETEASG